MKSIAVVGVAVFCWAAGGGPPLQAQDWLQWRGNNRDGVASGFEAPDQWPAELVRKWSVEVGNGVASPSFAGGRAYIMGLQNGEEVMRCLDAESGREIWKDSYPARAASGAASGFPGTRSSPAIGEGCVATLGVDGTVSCWEAENGKLLWRNDDQRGNVPRFSTSSSPLVAGGLCVVQFGSDREGGIAAYDLKSGSLKWTWDQDGSAYGSPVLMTVGIQTFVLAPAAKQLVAVALADGKALWSMDYVQGRYNAATPVVDGETVYIAGPDRGMTALKFSEEGGKITSSELWRNSDAEATVMYNTPVVTDGMLFGLSNSNLLFCVHADSGRMSWNRALATNAPAAPQPSPGERGAPPDAAGRGERPPTAGGGQGAGGGQRGGRGGRGGGGGRGGYGSVVSAGPVLMGLSPSSELVVYAPKSDSFQELARYKVATTPTYAYPVPVGNRIYVKDENSLTMWSLK